MIAKTFTIGKEDFSNWVKANRDVEDLTLTGTLDYGEYGDFGDFETALFSLNLKVLRLVDFHIPDYQYKDGKYETFDEYILFEAFFDQCCLSIVEKILINSDRVQTFVFIDGWIFSEDKRMLIHVPKTINEYIHPSGGSYMYWKRGIHGI